MPNSEAHPGGHPRPDNLGKSCKRDLARGCRRAGQSRLNTPYADRISPICRLTNGSRNRRASEALCIAGPDLGLDAARAGREAWPGFYARFRRLRRRRDQAKQSRERIPPVLLPRAVRLREDDEHAFLGEPCPGEALEAPFQSFIEGSRTIHVEAQMRGGFHFIDILPARPARARKSKSEFMLLDGNIRRDFDPWHGLAPARRSFKIINRNALAPIKILRACLANGVSRSAICRCSGLDVGAGWLLELRETAPAGLARRGGSRMSRAKTHPCLGVCSAGARNRRPRHLRPNPAFQGQCLTRWRGAFQLGLYARLPDDCRAECVA